MYSPASILRYVSFISKCEQPYYVSRFKSHDTNIYKTRQDLHKELLTYEH